MGLYETQNYEVQILTYNLSIRVYGLSDESWNLCEIRVYNLSHIVLALKRSIIALARKKYNLSYDEKQRLIFF